MKTSLVGGESDESLVVEVDDEGVDAGDEDVDAEVVLGAVDEVRPRDVPLHDHRRVLRDLRPLVHHLDPVATGQLKKIIHFSKVLRKIKLMKLPLKLQGEPSVGW